MVSASAFGPYKPCQKYITIGKRRQALSIYAVDPSMRRPVRRFQQLCPAVTVFKPKCDERVRISKLAKKKPKDSSLSAVVAILRFLALRALIEVS